MKRVHPVLDVAAGEYDLFWRLALTVRDCATEYRRLKSSTTILTKINRMLRYWELQCVRAICRKRRINELLSEIENHSRGRVCLSELKEMG